MHFVATRIAAAAVLLGLGAGCAYRPPPEPPRLVVARGPLRSVEGAGDPGSITVVVRAGSAYDPPGREGLAAAAARAVAAPLAGARVHVGADLVSFELPLASLGEFATRAAGAGIDDAAVGASVADAWGAPLRCADVATRAFDTWAMSGHPYGHAPEGRTGVLPTITAVEVRNFLAARYVRDGVVVGRTGPADVAPLEAALRPALSRAATPTVPPEPTVSGTLVVIAPVGDGVACAAFGSPREAPRSPVAAAGVAVASMVSGVAPTEARADVGARWVVDLGAGDGARLAQARAFADALRTEVDRERVGRGIAELRQRAEGATRGDRAAEVLLGAVAGRVGFAAGDLAAAGADLTPELATAEMRRLLDPATVRTVVVVQDLAAAGNLDNEPGVLVRSTEELFR